MPNTITKSETLQKARIGMEVLSNDGHKLGTVGDLDDERFKVDVRWGRDYWLLIRHVLFVDVPNDRILMEFAQSERKHFQVDPPQL